jgi:branched-chain amino acid transport system ATP-binding protein
VQGIFKILRELNAQGLSIFLVEQNVCQALKIAAQGHVLEHGKIVLHGTGAQLLDNPRVLTAYLGG